MLKVSSQVREEECDDWLVMSAKTKGEKNASS